MQLASLKESKQKNDLVLDTLQKTIDQNNAEIQHLSQQIAAKEDQIKQQTNTEFEHMLELEDMKTKVLELEHERDCARTAAKLAQDEAHRYAKELLKVQAPKVCNIPELYTHA